MREILFRGKTIDCNSKWVEGFYVHVPCGRFQCDEHMIQTVEEDGRIGQLYDVYDSTVGQFTGLVDVNGRKIFEGDIHGLPGWVITYCADVNEGLGMNAGWYIQRNNFESWVELENCTEHRIIGNIHDNPELL